MLETAIETLRALWQPGTKEYSGDRVQLPETTCYPRPARRSRSSSAAAATRTLGIAARLGDGCNLPSDDRVLDARLPVLRAQCRQAGRDPAEVAVTVLDVPVIGRDREHVAGLVETCAGGPARPRSRAAIMPAWRPTISAGTGCSPSAGSALSSSSLPDLAGPTTSAGSRHRHGRVRVTDRGSASAYSRHWRPSSR